MHPKALKIIILTISIAGVPLLSQASSDLSKTANTPYQASCTNGNFKGEIEGEWGIHHQVGTWVHINRYRITRSNGQGGGNKANINMVTSRYPWYVGGGSQTVNSPDSMVQDGQWHEWTHGGGGIIGNFDKIETTFKFIFDKSGSDPSCTTTKVFG